MHELAFADAARPTRFACLRLPLRDYTLGHEILLLRQRNPLLLLAQSDFNALPEADQIFAIKRAALVCAQDWAANTGRQKWIGLWGWLTRHADYPLAIAEFRNYLAVARSFPPIPDQETYEIAAGLSRDEMADRGRELGAPLLAQVLNHIGAQRLPLGVATVYDVPFSLAVWLYFTHMEDAGRLRILNRKEAEVAAEMAAHRAEIAARRPPVAAPCPP
jgi:hypothetical protein